MYGAEILRCTTYRVTEGYRDEELIWTEEEISDFTEHLIRPAVRNQPRLGFTDRTAGAQVYGSNDGENWVRLTVGEAPFTSQFSAVDVDEKYRGEKYRYLRIKKTTEYPDVLRGSMIRMLEIGEFRIWGARHEVR